MSKLPSFERLQYLAGLASEESERRKVSAAFVASQPDKGGSSELRLKGARHQQVLGEAFDEIASLLDWLAARWSRLEDLNSPYEPEWIRRKRERDEQVRRQQREAQPNYD